MPETWITRAQFAALSRKVCPPSTGLAALLAEIGINVEDDATVGDDDLADTSIHRLCVSHGYYAGVSVSWQDIRDRMPWLTRERCDAIADRAAEIAGDNDMAADLRSDGIDLAKNEMEADEPGSTWDPADEDTGLTFTAADGKVWSVADAGPTGCQRIQCSDGRLFEECGSEWELIDPTAPEYRANEAEFEGRDVDG